MQINNVLIKTNRHKKMIQDSIERVLASGLLILGPEVQKFESLFSQYLSVNHCVGVANGTDAIELSLRALGIGAGDQVATVANAGMYTTIAILAIGATPYFMDVAEDTHCATFDEVKLAVNAGVKAIVVTHLYGLIIPEIALIVEYCAVNHVLLIEDCAQAHGAQINGKYAGTYGDIASFSFYPTKNLGALGDGGAVVMNNQTLANHVRSLRTYGWSDKYTVRIVGGRNSRLDELQAAILSGFLPFLDEANIRRREIATLYSSLIHNPNVMVPPVRGEEYVAHLYVVQTPYRAQLQEHLYNNDIGSSVHYPIPDYQQPVFGNRFSEMQLQTTEKLQKEILTLPSYPEMTDEEVHTVIAHINKWAL